jgi:hypothetical protein
VAIERLERGTERVEGALAEIGASERRMVETQRLVGEAVVQVTATARAAAAPPEWEERLRGAAATEEEAARRIREAEERLRDSLD